MLLARKWQRQIKKKKIRVDVVSSHSALQVIQVDHLFPWQLKILPNVVHAKAE